VKGIAIKCGLFINSTVCLCFLSLIKINKNSIKNLLWSLSYWC